MSTSDSKCPELTADEIARRRDEAIRRALNTPPKPKQGSKDKKTAKRKGPKT